jgi:crotonobetainyl-CoA:carnitine CoA-transferase CaiB-like acyl-CoA transferase
VGSRGEETVDALAGGQRDLPLSGIRVLDLSRVIVGPYCAELLGDLGAEVIKVESPDGDVTREVGPRRNPGMSANFLIFNRNKRSIVLDLKRDGAREVLLQIARTCDVFVVNFRPAALERMGLTFADLAAAAPEIVYCRIVGFGEDHPDAHRPAIDDVVQAMSGLSAVQTEMLGQPAFVALPIADLVCGLFATSSVLAALTKRQRTGSGEEVEIRMYDAMASLVLSPHLSGACFEPALGEPLYRRSIAPTRRPYQTADGAICAAPYTSENWIRLFAELGMSEVLEDPRYKDRNRRAEHLEDLYRLITPILRQRTTAEWLEVFERLDIPAAPIRTTAELVEDESLYQSGILSLHDHPTEGLLRVLNGPFRFGGEATPVSRLPPGLGEHSEEVLREVGYDGDEIAGFAEKGLLGSATEN